MLLSSLAVVDGWSWGVVVSVTMFSLGDVG
jgi:hypothetical protein